MPRIYRGMLADGSKPMVGNDGRMLGVRTPADVVPGVAPDIAPRADGNVAPATGGMSVAPSLRELPPHRIPKRLRSQGVSYARGSDHLFVWAMGAGLFADAPVAPSLLLRVDQRNASHGLVEPDRIRQLDEYRQALAGTQDVWTVDEVVP